MAGNLDKLIGKKASFNTMALHRPYREGEKAEELAGEIVGWYIARGPDRNFAKVVVMIDDGTFEVQLSACAIT